MTVVDACSKFTEEMDKWKNVRAKVPSHFDMLGDIPGDIELNYDATESEIIQDMLDIAIHLLHVGREVYTVRGDRFRLRLELQEVKE